MGICWRFACVVPVLSTRGSCCFSYLGIVVFCGHGDLQTLYGCLFASCFDGCPIYVDFPVGYGGGIATSLTKVGVYPRYSFVCVGGCPGKMRFTLSVEGVVRGDLEKRCDFSAK